MVKHVIFPLFLLIIGFSQAQVLNHKKEYTRQDTLRGSNNEFRNWWDVKKYEIEVEPDFEKKSIKGLTLITFQVIELPINPVLQIDLQEPMELSVAQIQHTDGKQSTTVPISNIKREGNVYFLTLDQQLNVNETYKLFITYNGTPKIAKNPPWDGGWIFAKDKKGRPWMSVACQGLGASVWFPNKDYLGDEPDEGANLTMIVPSDLTAIANGKLLKIEDLKNQNTQINNNKVTRTTSLQKKITWQVQNPINNYNIIPYIGHYVHFQDTYQGENGKLALDYWVLDYNLEKAKKQFQQTKPMLKAFEHWFGPYPFYSDGYKLVESPYLGMEHQSAIAYGNGYKNGYMGSDLSGTGQGLKWDFIIIHESGHEWFGNNITIKDIADMWVHESFTAYSETLFLDFNYGTAIGNEYVIGTRKNILNDIPIIGDYGVNQEGSGDMYYKGANMIHTLRQLIEDDDLFRNILRGLNQKFYHQTVTTQQIEDYISKQSGKDFTQFFDQYLRTTQIPTLEWKREGKEIRYRWTNIVEGFDMPVHLANSDEWIFPTSEWKTIKKKSLEIDPNFYVYVKRVKLN